MWDNLARWVIQQGGFLGFYKYLRDTSPYLYFEVQGIYRFLVAQVSFTGLGGFAVPENLIV